MSDANDAQKPLELETELGVALDGNLAPWRIALEQRPWADPFRAMRADRTRERDLVAVVGVTDLPEWFKRANEWVGTMYRPGYDPSPAEQVLRNSWQFFQRGLSAALARAREPGKLPDSGGVLAFVDALNLCLVVDYRFVGQVPAIHVIDAIETPRTVFDVVDTLLHRPHETRTELKRMLQSSHRLVWHRDVLVHVDRREEPRVFGPSIDTLHLAELIANRYVELPLGEQPARVLELGTGSGQLAASVLRNLPGVERLTGFEIDPTSAQCTYRNWQINTEDRPGVLTNKGALVVGAFRPDLLAGGYDLVICNPPYIPEDPAVSRAAPREVRHGAVAGLELLEALLSASTDLVSPGGSLLIMVSSVTPREYLLTPEGFTPDWVWGAEGMSVLFEVEAVFARPAWLQRLVDSGGLTHPGDYYEHRLHAVWLTRTEEQ